MWAFYHVFIFLFIFVVAFLIKHLHGFFQVLIHMDNEEMLIVVTTIILFIEMLQHVWERVKSSMPILSNFNVATTSV